MSTIAIGAFAVARIEELSGPLFSPERLLPDWHDEAIAPHRHWLEPHYFDAASGNLMMSFHSWLVKTPHHTILVDTCVGNDKERPGSRFAHLDTPYLERLRATGTDPDAVDIVMCTHLHIDHVGWNTRLENGRWVPTFKNARYLFSRADRDYWDPASGRPIAPMNDGVFQDSVLPVIEAGQADLIDGIHEIETGLTLHPAPGHTPGNMMLKAASQGARGIFAGDIIHHPMQVYEPAWNASVDEDKPLAHATRRAMLEECAEHRALLLPGHFAAPHAGYIRKEKRNFSIEFLK